MIKLKDILFEVEDEDKVIQYDGGFDEYTLKISRKIIKAFLNKKNFKQEYWLERADDYAEFVLEVRFIKNDKLHYSHSIDAQGDMVTLVVHITYNPSKFPAAMNDLVAEVKEVVTHEIEHVGQQNFEDMFIVGGNEYPDYFSYLTSEEEIPAYAKGLIKRASTKRMTLDAALEEWHTENIRQFQKKKRTDWQQVKKIWVDWIIANKDKLKKFT